MGKVRETERVRDRASACTLSLCRTQIPTDFLAYSPASASALPACLPSSLPACLPSPCLPVPLAAQWSRKEYQYTTLRFYVDNSYLIQLQHPPTPTTLLCCFCRRRRRLRQCQQFRAIYIGRLTCNSGARDKPRYVLAAHRAALIALHDTGVALSTQAGVPARAHTNTSRRRHANATHGVRRACSALI